MSPIRASERAKYPKNWKEIRQRILVRAHHACEWPGCHVAHGEWVLRSDQDFADRKCCQYASEAIDNFPDGWTPVLIVLTIAHLDHDPTNCANDNLKAWCQLHHLRYDAKQHAKHAGETRHAKKNEHASLFAETTL